MLKTSPFVTEMFKKTNSVLKNETITIFCVQNGDFLTLKVAIYCVAAELCGVKTPEWFTIKPFVFMSSRGCSFSVTHSQNIFSVRFLSPSVFICS
jgi:hypothetical protein